MIEKELHCYSQVPSIRNFDLDFNGETFRVLKEKEEKRYGEYRTRRLVLEAWDRLWQGFALHR